MFFVFLYEFEILLIKTFDVTIVLIILFASQIIHISNDIFSNFNRSQIKFLNFQNNSSKKNLAKSNFN